MPTTITFKFDLDQEVSTPTGIDFIEAAALVWRPDRGKEVVYLVAGGRKWWSEANISGVVGSSDEKLPKKKGQ